MSKIRVDLESVQVTEGEGIGEGDFELRIQVQEGTNHMVWPSLNSSARIDKGWCSLHHQPRDRDVLGRLGNAQQEV